MCWQSLKEECFGGEQSLPSYEGSYYTKQPKLKNAYMLFYQRKNPEPGSQHQSRLPPSSLLQ